MSLCPKCKIWHDLTADSEKLSGSKQSSNVLVSSETSRNRAKNGAIIIASHGDKFCQRSERKTLSLQIEVEGWLLRACVVA